MRRGLILIALGLAIIPAWCLTWDLMNPHPTGLEIKDGAFLSLIPVSLGIVLFVSGLAQLWEAWLSRSRKR